MPTGYTHGIIEGKINTFPEFAKLCMKAFGACSHLRDEDMDSEYTPQVQSDYHDTEIARAKEKIDYFNELTEEKLITFYKVKLENEKKYLLENIAKTNESLKKLTEIKQNVENWTPPTTEHWGLKNFMREQLEITIRHDCDNDYNYQRLGIIETELMNIDPKSIRAERIEEAKNDISYHTEQKQKEMNRINKNNQWVEDLLRSLEQ